MKKVILIFSLLIMIGCTPLGKSNFSCVDDHAHAGCTPARDVYEQSNGGGNPAKQNMKSKNIEKSGTNEDRSIDPVVDTFVTPQLPDKPIPVRTPSRVMKIWVATWEAEESGALMAPGLIYTEIEPRRWVIGKPESSVSGAQSLKPLSKSSKTPN